MQLVTRCASERELSFVNSDSLARTERTRREDIVRKLGLMRRQDQTLQVLIRAPAVDDLNLFNRSLRYPGKPLRPNQAVIHDASNPSQSILFWNDLVYGKWLGFADEDVLMWDKNPEKSLKRNKK